MECPANWAIPGSHHIRPHPWHPPTLISPASLIIGGQWVIFALILKACLSWNVNSTVASETTPGVFLVSWKLWRSPEMLWSLTSFLSLRSWLAFAALIGLFEGKAQRYRGKVTDCDSHPVTPWGTNTDYSLYCALILTPRQGLGGSICSSISKIYT